MKRCFSTLGCAELGLDEVLQLARHHSFAGVELRALGGTIDLPAHLFASCGSPDALATRMSAGSVKIVAFDTSLKLVGSTDEEWQKTVDGFLPWTEAIGGTNLRVFDGGSNGGAEEIAQMAARVRWWQELRRARGWRSELMVETHDSLFTAAPILALVRAAPGALILWDSHHTWKRGGEDPVETWRAIRAHVVHIHIKDSVSEPSARHPYTYVLPGSGEFPAIGLLASLRSEFAGPLSLEWERMWHPYLPPLGEALDAATSAGWW
ncbi:MAG TPA: sugar phosphate isomerase/epimerase [Opitutaceae bacterium]|nr:sugar phosphate isomerase/epimerase [Opitutaceae bacterium]